jgi:PTH1 family peptidyl-tRNA hydrolase
VAAAATATSGGISRAQFGAYRSGEAAARAAWTTLQTTHPGLRGISPEIVRETFGDQPLWLLKPLAFMNLSGRAVAALARFYKIAPADILVAHDELDVAPGEAKIKFGGSHAGHNGLRDIHAQLGTGDYWRLRLGVGHPGDRAEVVNWVLKKPSLDHRIAIDQAISRALSAWPALCAGDMNRAMLLVHTSKPPRAKPARPDPPANEAPNE